MCPGSNESAGKRLSGKMNQGSTYLRNAFIPVGMGRLAREADLPGGAVPGAGQAKGQKRALVTVGHSILMIANYMMKRGAGYEELGGNYLDQQVRSISNDA